MQIALTSTTDILRYRQTSEGTRVLDLGCGDGERAIALAGRRFNRVTGLDSSISILELARQRAARRKVDVSFVCGNPRATPFASGTFDEVMLLGSLFGHGTTANEDEDLLKETNRLLKANGRFHLRFADADWIREHYRSESLESLPTGFIYRAGTLSRDGRHIRTEIFSSEEGIGIARHETQHEWLYSRHELTDLLQRRGFSAITYDMEARNGQPKHYFFPIPHHIAHCRANPGRASSRVSP